MTVRIPGWVLRAMVLLAVLGVGVAIGFALDAEDGGSGSSAAVADAGSGPEPAAESESGDAGEEASECEELGIDFEGQKEGRCEEDGEVLQVVNRDSLLRLPELHARLLDVELTDTISGGFTSDVANGTFAIFTLEITNKLNAPVEFDEFQEQVALSAMGNVYTEDFDAANGPLESSFLWIGEEIQPDGSLTGDVVFDVPEKAARRIEKEGNLTILNFSDVESPGSPSKPVGVIRTYPPRAG